MQNEADHDILIQIQTDVRWIKQQYVDHIKEESTKLGLLSNKVTALHRRVDWLMIAGILSICSLAISLWLK